MKLSKLAQTYDQISEIRGEPERVRILADLFKRLDRETLAAAAHLTIGEIVEPMLSEGMGIGPATMRDAFARLTGRSTREIDDEVKTSGDLSAMASELAGGRDTLTVVDLWKQVHEAVIENLDRGALIEGLLRRTTPAGAKYLTRIVLGQMRINVGMGTMMKGLARAFGVDVGALERLYAMTNDIGMTAVRASEGEGAVEHGGLALFRPYQFMNASKVESAEEIFERLTGKKIIFDVKYDGARLQIHFKRGRKPEIRLYSRRLSDVTASLPDVVESLAAAWTGKDAIIEAEAVAYDPTLKVKQPFESVLMRLGRKHGIAEAARSLPFVLYLFELLYDNGADLMDVPQRERRERLATLFTPTDRVKPATAIVTARPSEEAKFFARAIKAGHEGVMAKDPDALYIPGRRTDHWMKLKPAFETLDVVVVGGIWGSGRNRGTLSSLVVAVRDGDGLKTVGKVGAGLTEETLRTLTAKLEPMIIGSSGRNVEIEPEVVIEVDFQSIQKTTAYASGYALRIPRFKRVRSDKSLRDADTLARLKELYATLHGL